MVKFRLQNFVMSESGAVTVDWIVLTAGVALLGTVVVLGIKSGRDSIGAQIGETLTTASGTLPSPNFE